MSLPTHIRLFLLSRDGRAFAVTHEAARAVELREEYRRRGVTVELQEIISDRSPHATGVIGVTCYPCPSHHLVSTESVDGPSELHDGCCLAASRQDALDAIAFRELCDHDFKPTGEIEHQDGAEFVSTKCSKCGMPEVVVRPCKCVPASVFCPCGDGPCRC